MGKLPSVYYIRYTYIALQKRRIDVGGKLKSYLKSKRFRDMYYVPFTIIDVSFIKHTDGWKKEKFTQSEFDALYNELKKYRLPPGARIITPHELFIVRWADIRDVFWK